MKQIGVRRRALGWCSAILLLGAGVIGLSPSASATTPALSNIRVTSVGATTATIAWDTDIASDSQVAYGLTSAYGSSSTLKTTKVTAHSVNLTGLSANRTYHFQVRSRDAAGDLATSGDKTFGTPIGTTTAGGKTDSMDSDGINVTRITTADGGKLVSLAANVGAVDPSLARRSFQMAIYTASGSTPGTLVASSSTGTLVANSWNTVPITATLAPSTSYFLAYNTNGASASVNNLRYSNGGSSGWRTAGQTFGTWPTSFGGFTSQALTFSMYGTFSTDVTPPTVSISAPADGSTVSGSVTITADASDDTAVASVQFKVDGTNLSPADTVAPYTATWDTLPLLNGPRAITAVATDTVGLTTTSAPVNVQVSNPAKVTITSPAPGSTISGTSVTVVYSKTGDWVAGDGKHVHLSLDGGPTKMDFDTDGDHSFTFLDVPGGAHTVTAVVADVNHVEQPGSGSSVSFTTVAADVTPPTVSVTAPATGATVANTVTVTADAADDNAVVGVQFLLDGSPLGSEDTTAPYAVSWDTTTSTNASHTLSARARDVVNVTTSSPVTVTVANTDPRAQVGEWGPLTDWPIVSVHATQLYTGEILMWDAWELPTTQARLWNPSTNAFTTVPVGAGIFCAGQATDSNGNVIVMGGHSGGSELGIRNIYSFDPVTRTWNRKPDMANARWYPSVTQMPDGRMLTLSGQSTSGTWVANPEIYDPATSQVSQLSVTTPQFSEVQYPQTSVLPNGKVLAISSEHGAVTTFDPATNTLTQLGTTQVPYGVWTSFAPGQYLITGGAAQLDSYSPNHPVPSVRQSKILDMTSGSPVWSDAGNMLTARSFHNVTMLPTGEAIAIGGSTVVSDYSDTGTLTAEIWNPTSKTWRQVANPAAPRMYHSISMLMPDGRVLSSGGGRLSPAPDELNMQMYSPGYLFKGPRPTITSLPSNISLGSTMDLVTPQATDIAKVTLVSLGSVTHAADWNQHFMELPFTRNGTTLTVNTPANANLAPPNYYMVFAVDSNGVPSVARIVKLGVAPDTTAPVISGAQASGVTASQATITWTTDEAADTQVEYGPTTSYDSSTTLAPALVTAHSQDLTGLSAGTTYHYRVKSTDGAGNPAVSADHTFTTVAPDSLPPTVSVTAPASGATVSGSVTLTANAQDDVGVVGVQFKVDGASVGAEDTVAPYSLAWSSTGVPNGAHTITAVARDAAGNTTTSSGVQVTVSNQVPTGLVAAYSFNENSGSTFADSSGSGNNGSIYQATWAAGKFGSGLSFDGVDDYATVPDSASLDLSSTLTMEAWVRPTVSTNWRTILLKERGTSGLAYSLYAESGTALPSAWIYNGGDRSSIGPAALPLSAWSHVAATYDGASLKLYVNGTLVSTQAYTGPVPATANPLKIGGNAIWSEFYAGQIDEVRLYNKVLTQTQIQTDMNAPL